ncbi:MAG: hypothetical protein LN588_01840 [Rickettsia endosymbiont of Bryobia graminum]|nr:hypothetical protein [Rickettsia endosymbiont of Bryobia graminum]
MRKIVNPDKVIRYQNDLLNNYTHQKQLYNYKITTRINNLLLNTLKNIVLSDRTGGHYKYTSISDIIRSALEAYKNGMDLMVQREQGQYQETSFKVSQELKDFYMALPHNAKTEILERAILTYIKYKL